MKINYLLDDEFDPKLKEGDEIQCPSCKEWSTHEEWDETEVYCDLCGSHSAIGCLKCEDVFDHVDNIFKTRTPNEHYQAGTPQ